MISIRREDANENDQISIKEQRGSRLYPSNPGLWRDVNLAQREESVQVGPQ